MSFGAGSGGAGRLSLEDWAKLLEDRFFSRSNSGRPVYLAVDDEILDELAGAKGEGAASLLRVVRPQLRLHDPADLFEDVAAAGYRWVGNRFRGSCPLLPCLALCVLAASRMDASGGFSSQNYYERLRGLLSLTFSPQPGYRETVPAMFKLLHQWLDGALDGARGQSTIPADPSPAHIGYALSQVFMRESDRRKLTRFFVSFGLQPTDASNSAPLLQALRSWASRSDLSSGAKRFIRDDQFRAQAIAVLAGELRAWDRSERDADGRRVAAARLLLEVTPRLRWGLFAARPPGFPPDAVFATASGEEIRLREPADGWYHPEMFEEDAPELLLKALRIPQIFRRDNFAVRLSIEPITPLGPDPDSGCLAAARRISPGNRHWVLVREDLVGAVEEFLARVAREGWSPHPRAFPGWRLYRDVFVDLPPATSVIPELMALVPAVDARPELRGGLRINVGDSDRHYLLGGEPDLWVPEWLGGMPDFAVSLDAEVIDGLAGGTRYRLSGRGAGVGEHRVTAGMTSISFYVDEAAIQGPPWEAGACQIVLRPPGLQPSRADQDPDGPTVCGAVVRHSSADPGRWHPVLLPYGATQYVLIGREVGKVATCTAPSPPGWLARVDLDPQDFEIFADFPVAWVRIDWAYSGAEYVAMDVGAPLHVDAALDAASEWASHLDVPGRLRDPASDKARAEYLDVARLVASAEE